MSIQMISDETHSDTITIRQKKCNLKSGKLKHSLSVDIFCLSTKIYFYDKISNYSFHALTEKTISNT